MGEEVGNASKEKRRRGAKREKERMKIMKLGDRTHQRNRQEIDRNEDGKEKKNITTSSPSTSIPRVSQKTCGDKVPSPEISEPLQLKRKDQRIHHKGSQGSSPSGDKERVPASAPAGSDPGLRFPGSRGRTTDIEMLALGKSPLASVLPENAGLAA